MPLGTPRPDLVRSLERARARHSHARSAAPGPAGVPIHVGGPAPSQPTLIAGAAGAGTTPRRARQDPLLSLVHRITQGFQLKEYERARELGYDAYLEEQLEPLSIDDSELDARLASFPTLAMGPKEIHDGFPGDASQPYSEIKAASLLRSVYSQRQLLERMVELWGDHFHLDHNKSDLLYLWKPEDDRTVLRPHALGAFPALLSASAHGAGMLFYLDGWLNRAGAIQENHARELLELHTVGPGVGTEHDVQEVARCLTGWTLVDDPASPDYLRATFVGAYHDGGPKLVLGTPIPADPPRENLQRVLDVLAAHPATARRVASKLVRWFLTESPRETLVDEVAQVFLQTGGDVKAMLRVVLAKDNVAAAAGQKLRRPFHLAASLLRGLCADVHEVDHLLHHLRAMGHSPFDWPAPDGYPDTVEAWGRALLPRWRFASDLLDGRVQGVELPVVQITYQLGPDPDGTTGLAQRIDRRFLGQSLSNAEIAAVQRFLDGRTPNWATLGPAIALAASMPGYQWY